MAPKKKTTTNGNGAASNGSAPATTAQRLGAILKSSRDIMRKDKGLSGEIDRIPVLTWIMFLKFLDDMESMREEEAKLSGKKFKPAIESPYRWRDWAAKEDGITGDELIAFINQEECRRPDGSKGAGLFAYLRGLHGAEGGDRRDVIATVFKGTVNRMINGYLLRDVINKMNGIHFTSSDEIHTLGNFYESMLKEMRDAAGDSGEFYTPRAVVRFMVEVIDPRIGETVLDPACGTGGFLVEALSHMEKQCRTVQQRRKLQEGTILGGEAKPLPYLLAQMNLLLHGLETPRIEPGNTLAVPLRELGDKDRVDVILTNPPFGGEEERGILSNFPADKQTVETALLFLQLIMRKLRRAPKPGRAAVVVPNGVLFGDGIAARIKEELLREFNLHTIVRLPEGVFAPYTSIPTNLLFFDRNGTTRDVWFYALPLPEGRRQYTKTQPIQYNELVDCVKWWGDRRTSSRAWSVGVDELLAGGCNLDCLHANASGEEIRASPHELIDEIWLQQERVTALLRTLRSKMDSFARATKAAPLRRLGDVAPLQRRPAAVDPTKEYPQVSVRSFGRGTFHKAPLIGSEITWEKPHLVKRGDIVISNIKAWEGAVAVAAPEDDGRYGSHRYLTCVPVPNVVTARYVALYLLTPTGLRGLGAASPGSADRNRTLSTKALLDIQIPVPSYDSQLWFDDIWDILLELRTLQSNAASTGEELLLAAFSWAYLPGDGARENIPPKQRAGGDAERTSS